MKFELEEEFVKSEFLLIIIKHVGMVLNMFIKNTCICIGKKASRKCQEFPGTFQILQIISNNFSTLISILN